MRSKRIPPKKNLEVILRSGKSDHSCNYCTSCKCKWKTKKRERHNSLGTGAPPTKKNKKNANSIYQNKHPSQGHFSFLRVLLSKSEYQNPLHDRSMLQCVVMCCSILQYVAVRCSMLQYVIVLHLCSVIVAPHSLEDCVAEQYDAVCCSMLQYDAVLHLCSVIVAPHSLEECGSVSQGAAVCCNALQCVAACCSVLQCVAVCCSFAPPQSHGRVP